MEAKLIAEYLAWVPLTLLLFSNLPQFLKNMKRKSTTGLSTSMVMLTLTATTSGVLFVYLMRFPLAYRAMLPFILLMRVLIVSQI